MASDIPVVDICGKRTLEYIVDSLIRFNRGGDSIQIRAVGINTYKAMQVARILSNHFGASIISMDLREIKFNGSYSPCLTLLLDFKEEKRLDQKDYFLMKERFIDFAFYNLLFDSALLSDGELYIVGYNDQPLLKIVKDGWGIKCVNIGNDEHVSRLVAAYHRAGLLQPRNWEDIVDELIRFDDIILGIDTNILYHAAITEHILSAISLVDKWDYIYTPNWLLIVIPKAVMHEVEQAANLVDEHGFLKRNGRIGFRALQEILEIDQAMDIPGVSITIVGRANPALDTRVEIRELRKELISAIGTLKKEGQETREKITKPKISSGDTIIRDQFKEFLRQIEFHKGVYFLTADKSNRALAEAEGLHAIYYNPPPSDRIKDEIKPVELPYNCGNGNITIGVPIGKLIYELAVEFGTIKVDWNKGLITLSCDSRGESLDHWLHRKLMIRDKDGFKNLKKIYQHYGRISMSYIQEKLAQLFNER